jgi:hypothetical protein
MEGRDFLYRVKSKSEEFEDPELEDFEDEAIDRVADSVENLVGGGGEDDLMPSFGRVAEFSAMDSSDLLFLFVFELS